MQTILLIANTPEAAFKAVSYICEDIKSNSEADHKLYFARIMAGGFHISKGKVIEHEITPGITEKTSELTGEHELIIFPAIYNDGIEKLKSAKELLFVKNCMSAAGEGEKKQEFRKAIINWLLDDEAKWDYANIDLTEE